jgi:hypothetical protein
MRPELAIHIHQEKDLVKQGLILAENEFVSKWSTFFKVLGVPAEQEFALTCPGVRIALELAYENHFVAMGGFFFAEKYLASGMMVAPISKAILLEKPFWFICAKGRENSEEILWLREILHDSVSGMYNRVKHFDFFDESGKFQSKEF